MICVVHETCIIIKSKSKRRREQSYLSINIVDELDGFLNLAGKNRISNLHSLMDAVDIERFALVEVRLLRKLFSSTRVAFRNQIVHDDQVDVTAVVVSAQS